MVSALLVSTKYSRRYEPAAAIQAGSFHHSGSLADPVARHGQAGTGELRSSLLGQEAVAEK